MGPPKDHAAGIAAVASSLSHASAQMGVRRTLLTLLRVNQKVGLRLSASRHLLVVGRRSARTRCLAMPGNANNRPMCRWRG
ncbi:hypothetical protein [Streptomyces sp. NPDC050121]|uniref:hypothetical protein n=1 Tax=Streptomyces sp. NPDC050121 TaxID=3365601 RepID=UPI0037A5D501